MAAKPQLYDLRTEHLVNPLGIDETAPRFSWKIADSRKGAAQSAWQIQLASTAEALAAGVADLWDSGRIDTGQSVLVPYAGSAVEPHTRYHWRVRIWDQKGEALAWSQGAWFETGFLSAFASWPQAEWIGLQLPAAKLQPVRHLRKAFQLAAKPKSARLYITARGVFEPWLNGQRIGCDALVPGWTDYSVRIEYLSYDVSALLKKGDNCIGALIGDGWYTGYLGWDKARGGHRYYGEEPALLAVLRVEHADGSVEWIGSDASWRGTTGPVRSADLYHGETHDARRELGDWSRPAFAAKGWRRVKVLSFDPVALNGKAFEPVRETEELKPLKITEPAKGRYVFDLGQNIVGVARLRVRAAAGTKITLRFGEALQADGTLYTENLRSARCVDTYITSGKGVEVWQPRFTFHGFRYVELTGLKQRPSIAAITGIVLHTDMEPSGDFSTSHPLVNQLQSNISWGQRGNFLEVPTDCPQRDERMGWTGDAQVFAATACYNYNVAAFFHKWTRDLDDGQYPSGAYPDIAPDVFRLINPKGSGGNAAWADAGVICPWVIYQRYGDTRILENNYKGMCAWIDFQEKTSQDYLRGDTAYGDWLAPDATRPNWAPTPCDLIGTAYFAHTTGLMAKVARVLGKQADADRFTALRGKVVATFNRHYVTNTGRIAGDTQTAYLLALGFDLLPDSLIPNAMANLEKALVRRGNHLATGFVGTSLLCPVLSRFGRIDLAYKLLFNESCPSWLYTVKNGATTMWERWDNWTAEKGFGDVSLNSFNHYAYGAIGEWLYSCVGGIDVAEPGFRKILLRPKPGGDLSEASAALETPYGRVESKWKRTRSTFSWTILVPPNSEAIVVPPVSSLNAVKIDGKQWNGALAAPSDLGGDEGAGFMLPAGRYKLTMPG